MAVLGQVVAHWRAAVVEVRASSRGRNTGGTEGRPVVETLRISTTGLPSVPPVFRPRLVARTSTTAARQ